jgi:purine-nucleoside phosphorylase
VAQAAKRVGAWLDKLEPQIAIVLGSGLGGLAASVDGARRLAYSEIPGFPVPKVAGHGGELVAGQIEGRPVLLQSGRFHLYEGHDPQTVALPARVFAELGIRTLILTNAAGGVRLGFRPPALMLIADHLNLMWKNPIVGPVETGEQRFPDMSEPYDAELRALARRVALAEGLALEEGVYAGLLGPSYETPAEIRMLQRIGADAVGMSTVPEVIVARARGMRVMGISTITNLASGISPTKLSHEEVLAAGKQVAKDLERLVRGVVRRL